MPPAGILVRQEKKIMMSLPKLSALCLRPTRRPWVAATISVIEMIPQVMPNMVRNVRSLCAHKVWIVSWNRSRRFMVGCIPVALLQDHLLAFIQPGKLIRLDAVGDPQLH